MHEFIQAVTSYPTVVLSVLFVFVLLYWGLVVLGALDVEVLGVGDALDGAMEGVGEGVDGALDGADLPDDAGSVKSAGLVAGALTALRLDGVPLTIILSLVVVFAWMFTGSAMIIVGRVMEGGFLRSAIGTVVILAAVVVALVPTALLAQPFRLTMRTQLARSRRSVVGRTCTITTQRVTADFGQAELYVEGDWLLIPVRCQDENDLRSGSTALIFALDPDAETYLVVPHEGDGTGARPSRLQGPEEFDDTVPRRPPDQG